MRVFTVLMLVTYFLNGHESSYAGGGTSSSFSSSSITYYDYKSDVDDFFKKSRKNFSCKEHKIKGNSEMLGVNCISYNGEIEISNLKIKIITYAEKLGENEPKAVIDSIIEDYRSQGDLRLSVYEKLDDESIKKKMKYVRKLANEVVSPTSENLNGAIDTRTREKVDPVTEHDDGSDTALEANKR